MLKEPLLSYENIDRRGDTSPDTAHCVGGTALRQTEIHTYNHVDIVANKDSDMYEAWGEKLKVLFRHGVPSEWSPISSGRYNVMTGNVDGKRFLVKLKERRLEKGDAQMTDDEWAKEFIVPRKLVYADESILNEMKLSPRIKTALNHRDVQTAVHALGLNSISFIEPIIGGVSRLPNPDLPYTKHLEEIGWHRPDTDKFMVYEWVGGSAPDAQVGDALKTVVSEALRMEQIEAEQGGDLRCDHFLVDDNKNVYLFDAERFTHIAHT